MEKSLSSGFLSTSLSLLLAFFSGLTYSCITGFVKHMKNIHPAQLVLYRHWAIASMVLPQLVSRQESGHGLPGSRVILFVHAAASATAAFLHFTAFRYLPLGEAAVIVGSSPVAVTVAARIVLKEPFGLLQVISVFSTVIGVVLVTGLCETIFRTFRIYTTEDVYGLLAALASVIFITLHTLMLRKLKDVRYSTIMFTTAEVAIVESFIIIAFVGSFSLHYGGPQQVFIILIGVLSYVGLMAIIVALQNMEAGPTNTIKAATNISFSFLWQIIVFGDSPNSIEILGGILVSLSVVLLGFGKQINRFLPQRCITFC